MQETKLTNDQTLLIVLLTIALLILLRKKYTGKARVPRVAEYLLYIGQDRKTVAAMAGDLEEDFTTNIVPKFGVRLAQLWYWKQVVFSMPSGLWVFVRRTVMLATFSKGIHRLFRWL